MSLGYPVESVTEGLATLQVPRLNPDSDIHIQRQMSEAPVFYNPVQRTNRDTAVLALRVYQKRVGRGVDVCEPMTGTGVRGIRFVLETHAINSLVLGDLNPSALALARVNVNLNGLGERVKLRHLDANLLMALHTFPFGRFDYIDVDPFGSPTGFIDSAIRATKNHGVIALTATDMATLCGVNEGACRRKYGGSPLQGEFCHETAIRLLTSAIVRQGAIHEYGVTPLFSYYADHYVRGYYRIDKGARRVEAQLNQIGFIKYCPHCLHRLTSMDNAPENCLCGEKMRIGGPLWLGELSEKKYLEEMMVESDTLGQFRGTKAESILRLAFGEMGLPVGFYDIDKVCKLVSVKSISTIEVHKTIREAGFKVAPTHYGPRTLKTDATISDLTEIFK